MGVYTCYSALGELRQEDVKEDIRPFLIKKKKMLIPLPLTSP